MPVCLRPRTAANVYNFSCNSRIRCLMYICYDSSPGHSVQLFVSDAACRQQCGWSQAILKCFSWFVIALWDCLAHLANKLSDPDYQFSYFNTHSIRWFRLIPMFMDYINPDERLNEYRSAPVASPSHCILRLRYGCTPGGAAPQPVERVTDMPAGLPETASP